MTILTTYSSELIARELTLQERPYFSHLGVCLAYIKRAMYKRFERADRVLPSGRDPKISGSHSKLFGKTERAAVRVSFERKATQQRVEGLGTILTATRHCQRISQSRDANRARYSHRIITVKILGHCD